MLKPESSLHLTVAQVQDIHTQAILRFGGSDGLRDLRLLESAVAATQATYGGQSVFADVIEISIAYLFYLCRNHPFIDDNKRTALGACLVFLQLNDVAIEEPANGWYELTMSVATGELDRSGATAHVRKWL